MSTVAELIFSEELEALSEVAQNRGWNLAQNESPGFTLVLPARDNSLFGLDVGCDGYPGRPPVWRWCNPRTFIPDQGADVPKGTGGYFHNSGRICAPWNRIAYKQVDPKGPHDDWEVADWKTNPNTHGCVTLSAMALRMAVELASSRYQGRQQ